MISVVDELLVALDAIQEESKARILSWAWGVYDVYLENSAHTPRKILSFQQCSWSTAYHWRQCGSVSGRALTPEMRSSSTSVSTSSSATQSRVVSWSRSQSGNKEASNR